MTFSLPDLPFAFDALEPHVSAETMFHHHDRHHAGYVETLNRLLRERGEDTDDLDALVRDATGALFDNAAQAWNHAFLWRCLSPDGGGRPPQPLAGALEDAFDGVDAFRSAFADAATSHFGSGWAWLVQTKEGRLEVVTTHDADNPLRVLRTPLLACDLWEHAYYLDHRGDRAAYLDAFWEVVDWSAVADRLTWTEDHAPDGASSR